MVVIVKDAVAEQEPQPVPLLVQRIFDGIKSIGHAQTILDFRTFLKETASHKTKKPGAMAGLSRETRSIGP